RLARYVLQELLGWKSRAGAFAATAITLIFPFAILMATKEKAYMVAWPIFGTSNQLLASLTLLAVSVWLTRTGRNALFAIIPMIFMMVMTLWSLYLQIAPFVQALPAWVDGKAPKGQVITGGVVGVVLLVLSLWLIVEAARVLRSGPKMKPETELTAA